MSTEPKPYDAAPPVLRYDFSASALLFLLTTAAIGALDGMQAEAVQVAGWVLIAGIALRCRFDGFGLHSRAVNGLQVISLVAAALLWVADPNLRPCSALLCWAALTAFGRSVSTVPFLPWCWTIAVASCWLAFDSNVSSVHDLTRDSSRWISAHVGSLIGVPCDFGSIALGVPIWIVSTVLFVAALPQLRARRVLICLLGIASLPILLASHLLAARWLSLNVLGPYVGYEAPAMQSGVMTSIFISALLGSLIHWCVHVTPTVQAGKLRTSWTGVCALAVAIAVACYPYADSSERLKGRVLLYDQGYLAWNVPNNSVFGRDATGMFGLLPDRLRYSGLSVDRGSELSKKSLEGVDVLFTINLLRTLSPDQHAAVWEYVEHGGTLVCLGDHTGLGGIREPFNELLKPVGIEFEFDSAKPIGGDWTNGLRSFPSRITAGIHSGDAMPIGVGASLVVPLSARVVVSGTRCFGDAGDPSQKDRGFLGDYHFNPGEPLGDLPLVASARRGKGRVLVFGDTSPFQNGAFSQGHLFLDNCMRWALDDSPFSSRRTMAACVAALGLLGAATAFLVRRNLGLAVAAFALAPFAVHQPWTRAEAIQGTWEGGWVPAVVDATHGQPFDLRWWQDDSIGGLLLTLYRNRVWPRLEQDRLDYASEKLVVMIAPAEKISDAEVRRMRSFIEGGGVVLCSAGHEAGEHSRRFLEQFGFMIGSTPLGPAESTSLGGKVHFQCAYPIDGAPVGFRVLADAHGRPVIGWQAIGAGAFVLVSDSRFLMNPNVESGSTYVPDNVAFLAALIEHLREEERL